VFVYGLFFNKDSITRPHWLLLGVSYNNCQKFHVVKLYTLYADHETEFCVMCIIYFNVVQSSPAIETAKTYLFKYLLAGL